MTPRRQCLPPAMLFVHAPRIYATPPHRPLDLAVVGRFLWVDLLAPRNHARHVYFDATHLAPSMGAFPDRAERFANSPASQQWWLDKRPLPPPVPALSLPICLRSIRHRLLTSVTHYTDELVDEATVWNSTIDAADAGEAEDTGGEGTRTATTIKVEEDAYSGLSASP
jgi:hypothetical protein